jgi:hypothetical protein
MGIREDHGRRVLAPLDRSDDTVGTSSDIGATVNRAVIALSCALLSVACADDGDNAEPDVSNRDRDVPLAPDTEDVETADTLTGVDVIIDDAFTRPDIAGDTGPNDAEPEDVEPEDAEPEDVDPDRDVWGPLPETDDSVLLAAVQASREALTSYCECCNAAFISDPARCRLNALNGGLEFDECEINALEQAGASAAPYFTCMQAAFNDVRDCTPECSQVACLSCDSAFARATNACNVASPTVGAVLARCE